MKRLPLLYRVSARSGPYMGPSRATYHLTSLGTRLSLRGRRVWPTAHTRLVLASHNYSGKLSGCARIVFTGGTRADRDTTRSFVTRVHSAPSENIAGDTHLASQNNYGKLEHGQLARLSFRAARVWFRDYHLTAFVVRDWLYVTV